MDENKEKKGNTTRNILLAVIAIAMLLSSFGIGNYAGNRAANRAIDNIDSVSISSASVDKNGDLIIILSSGDKINAGNVKGEPGKDGADGKNGTNGINGSQGNTGATGANGKDGIGISSVKIDDNKELIITYTDGTSKSAGSVKGEKGDKGDTGSNGTGIASVEINDAGELVLILTDDTSINAGKIVGKDGTDGTNGSNGADGVGIRSVAIVNDELIVTLTDDTETNLGNVKGAKGDKGDPGEKGADGTNGLDGKGITDTSINADGYLIITYTDGSTQNAGKVISSGSSDTNDYALGSIITMGTFEQDNDTSNGEEPIEWIVIQNAGQQALLLSRDLLEYMPFDSSSTPVSYKDSSLRSWLTGTFYNDAFTDVEKAKIVEPNLMKVNFEFFDSKNSLIHDSFGDSNKIFVMSYYEYVLVLQTNVDITPIATEYIKAKGASGPTYSILMRDWGYNGGRCVYAYAPYAVGTADEEMILFPIMYNGAQGIASHERQQNANFCIRPAMWISIGE